MGIRVVMLTGDNEQTANAVKAQVGVDEVIAGVLPEGKEAVIRSLQKHGKVAMVGDGINDAPSLANANVGISMGGFGSDIAVESSDVVIMTDEPSKVAAAIKKAKKTRRIVLENIIGSISIKAIILALIAFGFSGMWLAIFADVGVSLIAVLNSLRTLLK